MKGALISACLDLYLLHLSNNRYGLKDLKHDLGVKYGKDKYFEDAELFGEIEKLTYPEIKEFLIRHVEKGEPVPYEKYFALAGVLYIAKENERVFTLGGMDITGAEGRIFIGQTGSMNEFGKKMGYKEGDELVSLNSEAMTPANTDIALQKFYSSTKEGDKVMVVVRRKNAAGNIETITLSAPAMLVDKPKLHQLRFDPNASEGQLKLRNVWLNIGR